MPGGKDSGRMARSWDVRERRQLWILSYQNRAAIPPGDLQEHKVQWHARGQSLFLFFLWSLPTFHILSLNLPWNLYFQHGYCPRAVFCAFAHHDSELHVQRTPYLASSQTSPVAGEQSPNGEHFLLTFEYYPFWAMQSVKNRLPSLRYISQASPTFLASDLPRWMEWTLLMASGWEYFPSFLDHASSPFRAMTVRKAAGQAS